MWADKIQYEQQFGGIRHRLEIKLPASGRRLDPQEVGKVLRVIMDAQNAPPKPQKEDEPAHA